MSCIDVTCCLAHSIIVVFSGTGVIYELVFRSVILRANLTKFPSSIMDVITDGSCTWLNSYVKNERLVILFR